MLAHEWRELEVLCERISDLRSRYAHAQRSKNVGLLDGLKDDIARVRRQREQLVHHISARLGSAAADRSHGVRLHDPHDADHKPATLVGFHED